ncbi:hypothetical protein BpHYR1_018276 [Brachionus plicatilis]|uniref:Uncharacterized protein n=1 Tax=Brachionus plicatilis TaxID=10195 RepID=A0A3M7Q6E4_BRAPC|nr:hypothetical protein BpHYR1_018276 [Brachionus plicatilis]
MDFQLSILNKHPLIYSLVYSLIKEQKRTDNELVRLKTGVIYKRKPKYLLLDEPIFNWHLAIFNLANLIKIKISAISIIAILIRSPTIARLLALLYRLMPRKIQNRDYYSEKKF